MAATPTRRIAMRRLYLSSSIIAAAAGLALAAPNMQEGEWENAIEMKMEMPGMPFAMPPMKFQRNHCLTQKDMVPDTAQKGQKCTIKEQNVSGDKVTWKSVCTDRDGTIEAEGEINYRGNAYQGAMKARMIPRDKGAPAMNMSYKLDGRYLGACKK
jgi:hypothetical protein